MSTGMLSDAEQALRERFEAVDAAAPAPVFILGAPRSGSTLLYQTVAAAFGLAYFSNFVNRFFAHAPIAGLAAQKALAAREPIAFSSRFGKTEGLFQPSEASSVMREWFGGEHPSQSRSTQFLPGQATLASVTCRAAESLFGAPLLVKNAWNCFRVAAIAAALPRSRFVWIRRDLGAAAKSDLHARYTVQGTPLAWNSATPANLEELRKRPHSEQVVENQYEFSAAIRGAVAALSAERHIEVWYEDLCRQPAAVISRLGAEFRDWPVARLEVLAGAARHPAVSWDIPAADSRDIDGYIRAQGSRLAPLRRAATAIQS